MSFFRKAFASLLFLRPPGVCLWSPDHISRQVAGVLATEAASSMFPILLPFILQKKVHSTHPVSNGAKGLTTHWGHQKCPRTGGLSAHAKGETEAVLRNTMY